MQRRTASYDKSYVGSSGPGLKSDNLQKVPTLSQAKAELAASYRRAGYTPREAALKVAELVGRIRARAVAV